MRIRVSAAVVTGALAFSALAVPAAQAAPAAEQIKLTNIKVNGGKDVVVGTTAQKTFTITFTASHSANVDADAQISASRNGGGILLPNEWSGGTNCTEISATASNCKGTFVVDPYYDLTNADATTWRTEVYLNSTDWESVYDSNNIKSWSLKRLSKLTTNASPEPIKKGKTLTVTGALTRANWDTEKYAGYTSQPVKLQYQKRGSSAWSTVKTIKSDSRGNLKTTVKASADGSFRYSFAGTATTPAVNSGADYVDVR